MEPHIWPDASLPGTCVTSQGSSLATLFGIRGLFTCTHHPCPLSPLRWVDCLSCAGGELKVALLLQNNTVETYSLKTSHKTPVADKTARLTLGGHRTDVRTLAFSSDNLAVLSASGDTVKVWNRYYQFRCSTSWKGLIIRFILLHSVKKLLLHWSLSSNCPAHCDRSTLQVIRTMACEYALCSLFVPGDRQIILGTKVCGHTESFRHSVQGLQSVSTTVLYKLLMCRWFSGFERVECISFWIL